MPRLQQIKRTNGSIVSSVNLPLEIIEELGWKKGDELVCEIIVDATANIKMMNVRRDE